MAKGIVYSVSASILFALLYYLGALMAPLTGQEVLGWRVLQMSPMVTVFILLTKQWYYVELIWKRLKANPVLFLVLLVNSGIIGLEFWLFMWAPRHGKGLEVSLGYFLLPLVMVCMGRFIYGERLTFLKKIATLLAILGVGNEFFQAGTISLETFMVVAGYGLYFYLRRRFDLAHIGGLWFDLTLLIPLSFWYVTSGVLSFEVLAEKPSLYFLIFALGLVSVSSWLTYILASRCLPFSLFGLLSYLEPVLLVIVSLLVGESIQAKQWPTYLLIWGAIMVLIIEGVLYLWEKRKDGSILTKSRQASVKNE